MDIRLTLTIVTHQLRSWFAGDDATSAAVAEPRRRDRGAVSLEQVLWFVAAGVSVAVVAGLLWAQIRTQAATPVVPPSAP